MIKIEVSYTEQAGRFWRAYVSIDGNRITTIKWLHELNQALKPWGVEFPAGYDDGAAEICRKAKDVLPFDIDVNDCMDIS